MTGRLIVDESLRRITTPFSRAGAKLEELQRVTGLETAHFLEMERYASALSPRAWSWLRAHTR